MPENGKVVPVTVIEAGPCVVTMKKTVENDGYEAVQVGFGDISPKAVNKPRKGHFAKAGVANKRVLKEFRISDMSNVNVGDLVKADTFETGDKVDVVGTSKGKATPALSNVGTATPSVRPTVPARSTDMRVLWAPALTRPEL